MKMTRNTKPVTLHIANFLFFLYLFEFKTTTSSTSRQNHIYFVASLSIKPSKAFTTASGLPVSRYGLGGAARSTQPSTLPSIYCGHLSNENGNDGDHGGAPFFFYYNPHRYPAFLSGIKEICSNEDKTKRADIFVASGGTDRSPIELDQRLNDALQYSGGDYLDMFVLEYICPEELTVDTSTWDNDPIKRLKPGKELEDAIQHATMWLHEKKVRTLCISTHSHVVAAVMARHEDIDALMIRYNMAHKNAAEEVSFPAAKEYGKPVIVFTTTRWNKLQQLPSSSQEEGGIITPTPTTADCLSFAFTSKVSPPVEVVLHSARDEDELKDALTNMKMGFDGDKEEEEMWRKYGEELECSNEDWFDEYPEERFLKASSVS